MVESLIGAMTLIGVVESLIGAMTLIGLVVLFFILSLYLTSHEDEQ